LLFLRGHRLHSLHAFLVCGWIVGMLASPPIEAACYAVMVPVALLRIRALAALRNDRLLLMGALSYGALMALAAISLAWTPEGVVLRFPFRLATVPLLALFSGVRASELRLACFIGGGYRVAIGALGLVGTDFPEGLVPSHSSRETPGLLAFGAASISLFAEPRWWLRVLPGASLALWAMAAAQIQSVGTVIATLFGGVIGLITSSLSIKRGLVVLIVMAVAMVSLGVLMEGSPLWIKADRKVGALVDPMTSSSLDLSAAAIDAALSQRLTIWYWTVSRLWSAPVVGHGAGSWEFEFRAAVASGEPLVPWEANPKRVGLQPHAHNLFAQAMYEFGAIGLLLLVTCLAAWSSAVWRSADQITRMFGITLLAALIVSRFNGQGDLLSRVSILFLGLSASLAGAQRFGRGQGPPELEASANAPRRG
jgi:O-antigen ligase